MKAGAVRALAEAHDVPTLEAAAEALAEREENVLGVEGVDNGERLTHLMLAIRVRARVDAAAEDARRQAAAEAAAKADPSKAARTPKGEQYWRRGLQCFGEGDFNGAVMQMNFALQFEADNAVFREYLEKAKAALAAKKADKTGNTYRIRL